MRSKPSPYANEAELVAGLRAKSQLAFSTLYDRYGPKLYGSLLRLTNDQETAKDLLQDSFVKVWHKMDTYDVSKGKLFTWLLNIAHYTAIDHKRSQNVRPQASHFLSDQETAHLLGQHGSVSPLRVEHIGLADLLDGLDSPQRQLIALRYFQGYSDEDLASHYSMPLGTVKTRIRDGLKKLRKVFEAKGYDFV